MPIRIPLWIPLRFPLRIQIQIQKILPSLKPCTALKWLLLQILYSKTRVSIVVGGKKKKSNFDEKKSYCAERSRDSALILPSEELNVGLAFIYRIYNIIPFASRQCVHSQVEVINHKPEKNRWKSIQQTRRTILKFFGAPSKYYKNAYS